VTRVVVGAVTVYVIELPSWRVLTLQRATGTRCPGSWEGVHGTIEPGEAPEDAAVREVLEETGLGVERLYNVTVQPFYLHGQATVQMAVVFAAVARGTVVLSGEHQACEWLPVGEARRRFSWPHARVVIDQILDILGERGDAGPLEDVLRVR
jgi:8-oxo-dGTP pyrophosphatase MutT (NUDIX family)